MRPKITIIATLFFVVLLTAAIKPFSISGSPKRYSGKIISISESGVNDAVFQLENVQTTFYINRGHEKFTVEELNSLIGKSVNLFCEEGWTPLDPMNNRSKSVERLEVNNVVFFPEEEFLNRN
jgi:hypothetical protein